MLGLGWTEMLVIGIVALVVIGPKDLPVVMNRIGKVAGQIRRMGTEFQREINRSTGLDEVRNLRNSISAPLKKTTEEIRREFNTMTPTGPKPSGAIKPTDPNVESVVDEIKARANMPVAKTADEKAAEYGFKPSSAPKTSEPADASVAEAKPAPKRKAPVRAKAAPTRPVVATDLPPVETAQASEAAPPAQSEPAAAPRKRAARKTAPSNIDAGATEPVASKRATRKPAAGAETAPAQSEPAAPKRRRAVKTTDGSAE
ncbi:Sec-independent protein translocase protein TatB [Devosia albogilva]|uniref:Sec-independent protein translocase protein TatB n=1 Tax=Devosia albogilva TaxID=429726 RepID=A0ABW5QPX2_9HYPH